MSLQTRKKITKYNYDESPIPKKVINRVNVLGKYQPENFIFTDRNGRQIGESEITEVEGDQNVTPQIFVEEDDDLDEQDFVDKELAAQHTEDEDHLEADLDQELTIEYPLRDFRPTRGKYCQRISRRSNLVSNILDQNDF